MNDNEIAAAARQLKGADQEAFLSKACGSNHELRQRIQQLLAGDSSIEATFDSNLTRHVGSNFPTADAASDDAVEDAYSPTIDSDGGFTTDSKEHLTEGDRIGPYRLVRPLGQGGMGEVWMAEQSEPVKRQVALKVIKRGIGSTDVLARFEAERQALAMMNHSNIARILDAGATPLGQPFFAMELVEGKPLTVFCDEQNLGIRERLELFVGVCAGVQHAHQKGVIHRDLKPGNILVSNVDGKFVPKVIDFGLAKAMESTQKLTDQSLSTGIGQILGTLKYMSPEQASLDSVDIDTRTDIYALGVMLYELLTGTTPLDDSVIQGQTTLRVLELIREQEPLKPSRRLANHSAAQVSQISIRRKTDHVRLNRELVGDLDWIVMKALEKDRVRRYESASGFASEVQHYLNGEPITTRPPSARYRIQKFVRKNRLLVSAASLLALSLLVGLIGTSVGMVWAIKAEKLASERFDEAESARKESEARRQEAEQNLAYAEKGNEILGSVFSALDPDANYASIAEFREALSKNLEMASAELDESNISNPISLASIQTKLGNSMLGIGQTEQAIELLEKAATTRKTILGESHELSLSSANILALAYQEQGNFEQALPLLEKTLRTSEETLGPADKDTLNTKTNLALVYNSAGQTQKAIALTKEVVEIETLDTNHQVMISALNNLGGMYQQEGMLGEASEVLEKSLELMKSNYGVDHPDTLLGMNNLATTYSGQGRLDDARDIFENALQKQQATLGPNHPTTLVTMSNLAHCYERLGNGPKAIELLEQTAEMMKVVFGSEHNSTLRVQRGLANLYSQTGRLQDAIPILEVTLKQRLSELGPTHPETIYTLNNLANAYDRLGQPEKSLPHHRAVLDAFSKSLPQDHPFLLIAKNNMAMAFKNGGQLEEAIPLFEQAAFGMERLGFEHPNARNVILNTCSALVAMEQHDRADAWREKWIGHIAEVKGKESIEYADELAMYGTVLIESKRGVEAERHLRNSMTIFESQIPDAWSTFSVQARLGAAFFLQEQYQEAEAPLVDGYHGMIERIQFIPQNNRRAHLPRAVQHLVDVYIALGKAEEVDKWRAEQKKLPEIISGKLTDPNSPATKILEFKQHQYRFYDIEVNAAEAHSLCEAAGGYLVRVDSISEQEFLQAEAAKQTLAHFYIDGNRRPGQTEWQYQDGSKMIKDFWAKGEPSLDISQAAHALIWRDGRWKAADEDGIQLRGFICEWDE